MDIVGIIVIVILGCVLFWGVNKLLHDFAIPPQISSVIIVLLVVLMVLALIGQLGYGSGPLLLRR